MTRRQVRTVALALAMSVAVAEGSEVAAAAAKPPAPSESEAPTAVAAVPTSSPDEIAAAAETCLVALEGSRLDERELRRAGWTRGEDRIGIRLYTRDGTHARIFVMAGSGRQCLVDAYGERLDSFDAIRDAIRARLTERFGDLSGETSTGSEGDFSRGYGFAVGNRMAVLSSERRADGLSIRFTTMSMDGMNLR